MADTVYQSLKGAWAAVQQQNLTQTCRFKPGEVPQALAPNPGPVKRSGHFSTILEQVNDHSAQTT